MSAYQSKNHQAWKKLRMPSNMSHQVPLPQSNSNAAKEMRLVVFLAILARELNEQIFQPFYISQNENDTREILLDLAMKDAKKESFCRAILLDINPEKQNLILEERKKIVIWNAGSYFLDLLSSARYEGFRRSLEDVVERACEMWKAFRYSEKRYEPDFDPTEEEWEPFPFANSEKFSQGHIDTGETVLTVYPRICRVISEECKTLHFATVLTRSQCIDAELEMRKREPSSPKSNRAIPERQRTRGLSISLSSATNQNGSFLEGKEQSNGHQKWKHWKGWNCCWGAFEQGTVPEVRIYVVWFALLLFRVCAVLLTLPTLKNRLRSFLIALANQHTSIPSWLLWGNKNVIDTGTLRNDFRLGMHKPQPDMNYTPIKVIGTIVSIVLDISIKIMN